MTRLIISPDQAEDLPWCHVYGGKVHVAEWTPSHRGWLTTYYEPDHQPRHTDANGVGRPDPVEPATLNRVAGVQGLRGLRVQDAITVGDDPL